MSVRPPKPELIVAPIQEADHEDVGKAFIAAFEEEPILLHVWPKDIQPPMSRRVENYVYERTLDVLHPTSTSLTDYTEMVVRLASAPHTVVGASIWRLPRDRTATAGDFTSEEKAAIEKEEAAREGRQKSERDAEIEAAMDVKFFKRMKKEMKRVQMKLFEGRPFMYLEFLFIHPDHQGIGAGKKLLEWGMNIADEAGVPTYLESTDVGLPVYQKLGFEVVDEIVIETSAGSTVAAPTCIRHPVKKA